MMLHMNIFQNPEQTENAGVLARRIAQWHGLDTENVEIPEVRGLWRVTSIVCHRGGSAKGGHYWAWRSVGEGRFAKMNDTKKVKYSSSIENNTNVEGSYLLLLERIQ
jgi:uncharacterized UBP type Zn finger protein